MHKAMIGVLALTTALAADSMCGKERLIEGNDLELKRCRWVSVTLFEEPDYRDFLEFDEGDVARFFFAVHSTYLSGVYTQAEDTVVVLLDDDEIRPATGYKFLVQRDTLSLIMSDFGQGWRSVKGATKFVCTERDADSTPSLEL